MLYQFSTYVGDRTKKVLLESYASFMIQNYMLKIYFFLSLFSPRKDFQSKQFKAFSNAQLQTKLRLMLRRGSGNVQVEFSYTCDTVYRGLCGVFMKTQFSKKLRPLHTICSVMRLYNTFKYHNIKIPNKDSEAYNNFCI